MEKPLDIKLRRQFASIYKMPHAKQRLTEISQLETAIGIAWMENTVSAEMRATLLQACEQYRKLLAAFL
jgi:hypothetical protein